jgi:hypothetical protein
MPSSFVVMSSFPILRRFQVLCDVNACCLENIYERLEGQQCLDHLRQQSKADSEDRHGITLQKNCSFFQLVGHICIMLGKT